MAKTLLSVTPDTMLYAKTHGAKYNASSREWYVEGEVPPELVNLVPHKANPVFEEVAPNCPKCQAVMVKRLRKNSRTPFWGCSRYRSDGLGCSGYVDYEEHLTKQLADKPGRVTDYLPDTVPPTTKPSYSESTSAKATIAEDDPRISRWAQLTELALRECHGKQEANRWLNTPKMALKGKTPLQSMTTSEGCDAVEALLRQLNQ